MTPLQTAIELRDTIEAIDSELLLTGQLKEAVDYALSLNAVQEKWHHRVDEEDMPTETGWYRVLVSGDSESIDGYQVYSFDDYAVFMFVTVDEDGASGSGPHDEELKFAIAWFGPIEIPPYTFSAS